MFLDGDWYYTETVSDSKIFGKKFKIHRGKVAESTKSVAAESCYGVLCYENGESLSSVTGIVPPILTLTMARTAVEILEKKFPEATLHDWERIEKEMRKLGFSGQTICPYSLPDAIGFAVMSNLGHFTESQLEEKPVGFIERYLTVHGYEWIESEKTWRSPQGKVWNRAENCWKTDATASNTLVWINHYNEPKLSAQN